VSGSLVAKLTFAAIAGAAALAAEDRPAERTAPLFDNLGAHEFPITTKSPEAQRYFNQGIRLCYGFNHPEAIRAFEETARLDPDCAMAYWGVALAYGVNINAPMMEDAVPKAFEALQQARKRADRASPREQAYIDALGKRYTDQPVKDRAPLDRAYADAMREVCRRFPDDLDAATLFAEALMDTMPWNYWTKEGKPQPGTEELVATLEGVLRRNPDHAGANHYYIHAVEASTRPERGLAAAYRLGSLCPGAGHLVHMPSHIFLRLGYYHDAAVANERAIAADEGYISRCKAQGFYPANYYSHNAHFLWYVEATEGRGADALRAARKAAAIPSDKEAADMPHLQWIKSTPALALARFGRWDDVVAEPRPPGERRYEAAMAHYARGLAFARQRKTADADREAAELDRIAEAKETAALETPQFPGLSLIRLARAVLQAERDGLGGNTADRVKRLEEAVRLQDELAYMEPPYWYFPVRQLLGAALVEAGRTDQAVAAYREDLKQNPRNGWSLFGLLQCLRAHGKAAEAAEVQRQFQDVWKYADVTLTASCY
jgi:tetratricopeptide (TPR) repeat protein